MKIKHNIYDKISDLETRNENRLHLTANENRMSDTARRFLSSSLSDRYYFGGGTKNGKKIGSFFVTGLPEVEDLVSLAEKALKKMLSAKVVNLNALSGIHAMTCAILSATNPGDLVLTIRHEDGGHFATEGLLKATGRKHDFLVINPGTMEIDYLNLKKVTQEKKVKAVYLDPSYFLKPFDLRSIKKSVGKDVCVIYDASHVLGLIVGGQFQNPLKEGSDIICSNTHKTFPGPQKGILAFKDKRKGVEAENIIKSLYSSTHTHHLLALSVTILEMEKFGKEYALQIIKNAQALSVALSELGFEIRSSGAKRHTLNHQVHMFLPQNENHGSVFDKLIRNDISVNIDRLLGKRSFIRFGVQEMTRLGMREKNMVEIASVLCEALSGKDVKASVKTMVRQFSKIDYSFDMIYDGKRIN
ncbi:MAG: hypothetical protein NT098_02340 [Candidatus Parcubacteria bacterium]|nr:hypothetical protein [Candidatus Parcubacteria bacterium]